MAHTAVLHAIDHLALIGEQLNEHSPGRHTMPQRVPADKCFLELTRGREGEGGDIDIYIVHYASCMVGSTGIRAVQYLVHRTLYRVCCMYLKQY